jgi:two-component system LytT family sensor kinase
MSRGRLWTVVFGCWTLLALLFATQSLVYFAYSGTAVNSRRVIATTLTDWYLWAALTPAIAWLARRAPIVSPRWRSALLVHVPASIAVAVLKLALRFAIGRVVPLLATLAFPLILIAQFHLNLTTYWVIAGLAHAVDYYRKYQERERRASQLEARLAQAQLEVLRMQLHPHFLFNTLHAISALVRSAPEAAERMIAQLSDLLRLTLDNIGRDTVPVKDEMEFVDRYLAIQQTRFGARLKVTQRVDPDVLDARVPSQILQPIVENAIRHGIGPRAGGGTVDIDVSTRNGDIVLRVSDNGCGLPVAGPAALRPGVGLTNTQARLHEMYGRAARITLSNAVRGGLVAEIVIPR